MPVTFGLILCLVVVVILFFIFLSAGDDDNADQDDESVKRRILRLPIAESIARTSDNQDARLRGTLIYAERTAPLRAPISDRPCTAWRVVVEERRSDDDENTRWEQVVDDSEASHFFLEDESGRAHVAGGALTLALDFDANDAQGLLDVGTPALRAFMEARGLEYEGILLRKTLRAREGILEAGEIITVAGRATTKTQEGVALVHVGPLSTGDLLASDDPELGRGQAKPL